MGRSGHNFGKVSPGAPGPRVGDGQVRLPGRQSWEGEGMGQSVRGRERKHGRCWLLAFQAVRSSRVGVTDGLCAARSQRAPRGLVGRLWTGKGSRLEAQAGLLQAHW